MKNDSAIIKIIASIAESLKIRPFRFRTNILKKNISIHIRR